MLSNVVKIAFGIVFLAYVVLQFLRFCQPKAVMINDVYASLHAWEANKRMQLEMEKLKDKNVSGKDQLYTTPPPTVKAPTPNPRKKVPVEIHPPADRPPPLTEGAKMNRLRRLCERKPSGKCRVGEALHDKWRKATKSEREELIDELEKANWSEDST